MKIFAIVICYNGRKWVDKCIGSLIQSSLPINIIVVDNGSSDGTVDYLKTTYPMVDIIISSSNLGFGKANNIGFTKALNSNADYVLLLNQDAWVEKSTIEGLIKLHKVNIEYAVLCPIQLNGEGKLVDERFYNFTLTKSRELISDLIIKRENVNDIYPVVFSNAACWLIPSEILKKFDGFDPLYHMYGEDDDFLNRVQYGGKKVGICPKYKVFHDREDRLEKLNFKKQLNAIYVSYLVDLKNPMKNAKAKVYFGLNVLKYFLYATILNDKQYFFCKAISSIKIIKKYSTIIKHRELERTSKVNYLADKNI